MEALRLFLVRVVPLLVFIVWFYEVMKERQQHAKSQLVCKWYTNPVFIIITWYVWKIIINYVLTGNIFGQ